MTTFVSDLASALSAETLKMKRTLALGLAFLAPLLVVFLEFLLFLQRGELMIPKSGNIWTVLMHNSLLLWDILMVPLFVTLQTALLAGLEHGNKNWKHIFAVPISRGAVYAAKQIMAMALIGLSTPLLWAAVIGAGLLLRVLKPGIGFEAAAPMWPVLQFALLSYVTSWLIVSIHAWIGMRWPSFVVAMGVGVAATVISAMLLQSEYSRFFPWMLPAVVTREAIVNGAFSYGLIAAGALGGIFGAILGGLAFTRRDVL